MASRWLGRHVNLKHMDGGRWVVVELDDKDLARVKPLDETAKTLAGFTPDGVVWFSKRDLKEVNHQQETLL